MRNGADTDHLKPTSGRRLSFGWLTHAAALGAMLMLLFASSAEAAHGVSVRPVLVSKVVSTGSQASAWFKVSRGATCRLRASKRHALASRSRPVRVIHPLLQYHWTVPRGAGSGAWKVTLACARAHKRRAASATVQVRHGKSRRGHALFARGLRPTQASVTTAGDGRGGGSWKPFGTVLVRGESWLGGRGVDVRSNGLIGCYASCNVSTPYGIAYQCVELVQHLIVSRHWSPRIYGNANEQYANASTKYFDKHPNGSGYTPVPGDIIVYRGGYGGFGHVSIVEWVSGGRIGWVEQNASPSGRGS